MVQSININEFLFGRTKAEKKLEVIKNLSAKEVMNVNDATIIRIYKECRDGRDRFYINSKRRVGNDWNSTIEFIYEYQGKAFLMLYIQNSSTDSSISKSLSEFKRGGTWYGHIAGSYTYNSEDVIRTLRCILMEYVYWKYIEKAERDKAKKLESIAGWKITNPVSNYFYEKWDCWHRMEYNNNLRKAYYAGKDAVEEYAKSHVDELYGKSVEELQAIYKEVFRKAANW
jgi:hypothetical protein